VAFDDRLAVLVADVLQRSMSTVRTRRTRKAFAPGRIALRGSPALPGIPPLA